MITGLLGVEPTTNQIEPALVAVGLVKSSDSKS